MGPGEGGLRVREHGQLGRSGGQERYENGVELT